MLTRFLIDDKSISLDYFFEQLLPLSFEVTKRSDSFWNSHNQLSAGKVYQIIASSGSGKSTFIAFLAGLRGDYSGNILFNDSNLSKYSPNDWSIYRSKWLSFVFQDLRLFPSLTARQNILISNSINASKHIAVHQIEERASLLNIHDKLEVPVSLLSFGQMQRVAILRALAKPYQWIVLDEPFSHLDHENASIAWNLIQADAKEKNAGVIITSLDPYPFIHADQIFHL
jgi:putative ABC transport system ATP-binding protein